MCKQLKKITAIASAISSLPCLLYGAPASYKTARSAQPQTQVTQTKEPSSCPKEHLSRIELRHRDPRGLGYDDGYTTLEVFLTPTWEYDAQPFIDLRGHIFNDGKWAANAGIGTRFSVTNKVALGANVYYDFRDAKGISPNQVGGGIEALSEWADFRLNGYYPFSGKTNFNCPEFCRFECNDAIATQDITAALPHIYAELGAPIGWVFKEVDLYIAAGPYYLFERTIQGADLGDAWGGRVRLAFKPWDGIRLEGEVTWDRIYGTRPQGVITLSAPFRPANMRKNGRSFERKYAGKCRDEALRTARMTQQVYRDEIIPVQDKTNEFAINRTCFPCPKLIFVNNCCCDGCGIFEAPFPTLSQALKKARRGDIVYVFPGNGSSFGLNEGYQLPDGVRLIGSCTDFELCCIPIPACTCECPELSCAATTTPPPILTLGEGNEVAGLKFFGGELAIDTSKARNFCIRNNIFTANETGIGTFGNSSMPSGQKTIIGNCFENMGTAGIAFYTDNAYKANICQNTFNGILSSGIAFPELPSHVEINIVENCFSDTIGGDLIFFGEMVHGNVNIAKNCFFGNANSTLANFDPITASSLTFCQNKIHGATENGWQFAGPITNDSQLCFIQNEWIGVGAVAIGFFSSIDNTSLLFENNSFLGIGNSGIFFDGLPSLNVEIIANCNCFAGIGSGGIVINNIFDNLHFKSCQNIFEGMPAGIAINSALTLSNFYSFCDSFVGLEDGIIFSGLVDTSVTIEKICMQGVGNSGIAFQGIISASDITITNSKFGGVNNQGIVLSNAIFSTPIEITHNSFIGNGFGIEFSNSLSDSPLFIKHNTFNNIFGSGILSTGSIVGAEQVISNNCFRNVLGDAIALSGGIEDGNLVIRGNCFEVIGGDAFDSGILLNTPLIVENNCLENVAGSAFVFDLEMISSSLVFNCNKLTNVGSFGFSFCEAMQDLTVDITNNTFCGLTGPVIEICDAVMNNVFLTVQGNSFIDILGPAIEIDKDLMGGEIVIDRNLFRRISDTAILFTGNIEQTLVDIESNIFLDIVNHAIAVQGQISNEPEFFIFSNCMNSISSDGSENSGSAIFFNGDIDFSVIGIIGNSMTNVEAHGVHFLDEIQTFAQITLHDNILSNIEQKGFFFDSFVMGTNPYEPAFVSIEKNILTFIGEEGVLFEDSLSNCQIDFNLNQLRNIGGAGFRTVTIYNQTDLLASNNTMRIVGDNAFSIENPIVGFISNSMLAFENNNLFEITGHGFFIESPPSDSTITFSNNYLDDIGETAIFFDPTIIASEISISGNQAKNVALEGIRFENLIEDSTVTITGNTLNQIGQTGILFVSDIQLDTNISVTSNNLQHVGTAGTFDGIAFTGDILSGGLINPSPILTLSFNSLMDVSGNGFFFDGTIEGSFLGSSASLKASQNLLCGIGSNGFLFTDFITGLATFDLNTLDQIGGDGFFFDAGLSLQAALIFEKNCLTHITGNGFNLNSDIAPFTNPRFDTNMMQNIGANGIRFGKEIGDTVVVEFFDNSLMKVALDGIVFEDVIGSEAEITGTGNSFVCITGNGISHLSNIEGGASLVAITSVNYSCNKFSSIGKNGVVFADNVGTAPVGAITTRVCFNENTLTGVSLAGLRLGEISNFELQRGFFYASNNTFSGISQADLIVFLEGSAAIIEDNTFAHPVTVCSEGAGAIVNCLTLQGNTNSSSYIIDGQAAAGFNLQPGANQGQFEAANTGNYAFLGTPSFIACPLSGPTDCPDCN